MSLPYPEFVKRFWRGQKPEFRINRVRINESLLYKINSVSTCNRIIPVFPRIVPGAIIRGNTYLFSFP